MQHIKVFIDGSHGTTGLRIMDRLQQRTDVTILSVPEEKKKDPQIRQDAMRQSDVTFLCLPDAAAIESAELCDNPNTVLIDTSTAHRTSPLWTYGFAELNAAQRESIRSSHRIAVPGCHATGFVSIVSPLIRAGILPKEYPVVCHSVTGFSGGGKSMIAQYTAHTSDALDAPGQYAIGQDHKHLKEMRFYTGLTNTPVFTPIVANYYSGMSTTVNLFSHLLNHNLTPDQIADIFREHYKACPLFSVKRYDNCTVYANKYTGKDVIEIAVSGNDERIFITALFDNLGKGASGAALQCMNIAMGLPETTGLIV